MTRYYNIAWEAIQPLGRDEYSIRDMRHLEQVTNNLVGEFRKEGLIIYKDDNMTQLNSISIKFNTLEDGVVDINSIYIKLK